MPVKLVGKGGKGQWDWGMHRDGHPIHLGPNPGRLIKWLELVWLPLMLVDDWGATHRDLS